jgi:hypothetical protein
MALTIKQKKDCRWDIVSLGEVMLRFDPGDRRIATARSFDVCEGGGEYNVARGLKRCFGLDAAVVTAFVDDPVGRLSSTTAWAMRRATGLILPSAASASARRWEVTIAATPLFLN